MVVAASAAVACLVLVGLEGAARAGTPSGYRCGDGGEPVFGTGCKCPRGKIDARDSEDNAICAPRPAPPRRPLPPRPAAPASATRAADQDAKCRAGDAAACTAA